MKKLLFFTTILFIVVSLSSCAGLKAPYKTQEEAAMYSQKYNSLIIFEGVIYKNGEKYGKYELTDIDTLTTLVTYSNTVDEVVGSMILEGVSPKTAILKLSTGKEVTLNKREMEIDVDEEDGIVYLIENMILKPEEAKKNEEVIINVPNGIVSTDIKAKNIEKNHNAKNEEVTINVPNDTVSKDIKAKNIEKNHNAKNEEAKEYIDLRYKFKKNLEWRYESRENVKVSMSLNVPGMNLSGMPGMNNGSMTTRVMVVTDFSIKILKINKDNSAIFESNINSFKTYSMPEKKLIASNGKIRNLKVKGVITDKGKVKFLDEMFLIKTEKGETFLVNSSTKNKKGSVEGSASFNGEKIELKASFDPRSGKIKVLGKHSKKKHAKKLNTKKENSRIDILPKKAMELFLLPEGGVVLNKNVRINMPNAKIDLLVERNNNDIKLTSSYQTDQDNKDMDDNDVKIYSKIKTKGEVIFDTNIGKIKKIKANIYTKNSMNGMNTTSTSDITMVEK